MVASVFDRVPLNVSFRRMLTGHNLNLWHDLVTRISHVQLNNNVDAFCWNLTQTVTFTVSSMYIALISNGNVQFDKHLWKLKMPLKIKIFMWFLKRGVILTKDNLIRRNWNGNKLCFFCSSDETIQHLFFTYHVAKFLWRVVHYAFDLSPPQSITHLFGNWLRRVGTKLTRVGSLCHITPALLISHQSTRMLLRLLRTGWSSSGLGSLRSRPTQQKTKTNDDTRPLISWTQ